MPWKVFEENDKFCVHKMNADGSKGDTIPGGCHPTKEKAAAHARAMYASENKEITEDTITKLKELDGEDAVEKSSAILDEWKSRITANEKDCYPSETSYVPWGVYSFSELDQQRDAREKAQEIGQITGDFQSMVYNIINSSSDMVGDRVEALDTLYNEFRSRIDQGVNSEEKEIDETEDKASKRSDVSEADKKRAVGEYGDVTYADETNKKYPIDTEEHIRSAWNYIGQEKNQEKYSSGEVAGIKRKIISAWKKKIDPAGPPSAKKKDVMSLLDELVNKVKSFFREESDDDTGITVWKEGDQYWFLGRYSNMFRDNDYPKPEIISSDSHKRFVQLVKEGKAPLPELRVWHKKSWIVGRALDVAYDDSGFAVAIGVFDAGRGDVAEALMKSKEPIRMSHGMPLSTIKRDPNDSSIIIEHETREISFLPAWAAANKLTGFEVLNSESKEDSMAIPDETKKEWISKLGIKPETLDSLEATNAADANKAIDEGIEHKEVEEVAQPATQETTEVQPAEPPTLISIEDINTAVRDTVAGIVSPVIDRLNQLEANMKELKEASDKRDEALKGTPTASLGQLLGDFAKSAIGVPETKVDGRASLAQSKPKETAAEVTGRTGIPFIDQMLAGDNQ